jgi:ABC-type Fe3+-hydroxamate transport system substrate-binding protein
VSEYIQFIVLRRKGTWSVKAADLIRGFAGQLEAMQAGIELANESGKNGKPSVVLFQVGKNQFDPIWTYGKDSYPPSKAALPAISEVTAAGRT